MLHTVSRNQRSSQSSTYRHIRFLNLCRIIDANWCVCSATCVVRWWCWSLPQTKTHTQCGCVESRCVLCVSSVTPHVLLWLRGSLCLHFNDSKYSNRCVSAKNGYLCVGNECDCCWWKANIWGVGGWLVVNGMCWANSVSTNLFADAICKFARCSAEGHRTGTWTLLFWVVFVNVWLWFVAVYRLLRGISVCGITFERKETFL